MYNLKVSSTASARSNPWQPTRWTYYGVNFDARQPCCEHNRVERSVPTQCYCHLGWWWHFCNLTNKLSSRKHLKNNNKLYMQWLFVLSVRQRFHVTHDCTNAFVYFTYFEELKWSVSIVFKTTIPRQTYVWNKVLGGVDYEVGYCMQNNGAVHNI